MNPSWRQSYSRYKSYFLNIVGRYKERADIKAYLEVLLSLVTVSVFAIFALRPTFLTIAELLKEIESKKGTLAQMEEKIQKLSSAQSMYDRERKNIALLDTALPKNPNVESFVKQIEGLSGKHQLPISRFSIESVSVLGSSKDVQAKDSNLSRTAEIKFSLGTTVSIDQYPTLINFVSDVQNLRRPVIINSTRFSSGSDEQTKTIIMNFEGTFPYYQ